MVLLSRSGTIASGAEHHLEFLKAESGSNVQVRRCDVTDAAAVQAIVDETHRNVASIAGIMHTAGVLQDAMLENQTTEGFGIVWRPKVDGALNLRQACSKCGCVLDMFVLFSSAASLFGQTGQANYSAANAVLDAMAHSWREDGLAAVSVQWGSWTESGMA